MKIFWNSLDRWTWTREWRTFCGAQKEITGSHFKTEGYKTISKQFYVLVTTVASVIKKHIRLWLKLLRPWDCNLTSRDMGRECNPRLIRRIVWMLDKEPRKTSKAIHCYLQIQEYVSVWLHRPSPFDQEWVPWEKIQEDYTAERTTGKCQTGIC